MSIVGFKKKSVIRFGSNVSGKPSSSQYWLSQGPFGKDTTTLINEGYNGFSLNGSKRNVGYVGKTYCMSKKGTPFKGIYPRGNGGYYGQYKNPDPYYNINEVNTKGTQENYVKPTVLTTSGMLEKKYRWIKSGQYPNYWVQPNVGYSNLSDNSSQGHYIEKLSTAANTETDINNSDKYINNIKCNTIQNNEPSFSCNKSKSVALMTYNNAARNGLYTKYINNSLNASDYTMKVKRVCSNPTGAQKPFPYATNGNPCNNTNLIYTSPPEWYLNSGSLFK